MQLQNKFNNEKWSFYHNLSGPNKKIEKNFNFGPLRSKNWTLEVQKFPNFKLFQFFDQG